MSKGIDHAEARDAIIEKVENERLRVDPAMRRVVGGRATDKTAASTSQVARFETDILSTSENIGTLMYLAGRWILWRIEESN